MKPALVIGSLLGLVSCDQSASSSSSPPAENSTPAHPWDIIPDDPTLVSGRTIYLAECSGCHNEGEEGAPSLTDTDSWSKRKAKGLDVLLDHAINGYQGPDGKMPARGGTPSLTDQEVTNAVKFILHTTTQEP